MTREEAAAHSRLAALLTRHVHLKLADTAPPPPMPGNRAKNRGPAILYGKGTAHKDYATRRPAPVALRPNKWGFADGETLVVIGGIHAGRAGAYCGVSNGDSVNLRTVGGERFAVRAKYLVRP